MKKIYIYTLSILLFSNFKAQDLQPTHLLEYYYSDPWLLQLNTEGKKIKEIAYHSSKNPTDRNYTTLNPEGQVLEIEYTNRWNIGPFRFKSHSHRKNEYRSEERRVGKE